MVLRLGEEGLIRGLLSDQQQAFFEQSYPSFTTRRRRLQALRRFVLDHREQICAAIAKDYGHRSRHETLVTEVLPVLKEIQHALAHLRRWMRVQKRSVDRTAFGLARNVVAPQPRGVVGVIVPWNFPLNLSCMPLVSILAAGNHAMVKMSESSAHLADLIINNMPRYLSADEVVFVKDSGGLGPLFSALPFDHLVFTGSTQTGRAVMAAAAQNLCPVTLELGGRSPAVVFPDFSVRQAAERIMYVKCLNAGQICTTVDHVYVPRASVEAFVTACRNYVETRYRRLDSLDYTSVIHRAAYDRLAQALSEARARGARVVPLMPAPIEDADQHRLAPHLVIDPPADLALMTREIFGPILPVLPYDDATVVIGQLRRGPKPLAFYPFTHDRLLVQRLIHEVPAGGVSVNDALFHVAQGDLPFGGVGESGMGHYHGWEGFQTFSQLKPVFYQSRWPATTLLRPPYGPLLEKIVAFLSR
jgi:coniferyl-aldehyde dehydrogenase